MSDILHISLAVAGFVLVVWIAGVIQNRRMRRVAAKRSEDLICSFARSLDCRHLDTQVIRATYEEFQHYLQDVSPTFPIRRTDRFEKDLHIDGDDVTDILVAVTKRCDRVNEFTAAWPKERKIETVADLIQYVCNLPKSHVA
jgi:acyl carrier protein